MLQTFSTQNLLAFHTQRINDWKRNPSIDVSSTTSLWQGIEENHAYNFQLWQTEDKARRDDLGFEFVYHAKRAIDRFNQERNNRMEIIDECFIQALKPRPPEQCPIHSETPGMMIDRLSIMALKIYHMRLQAERVSATKAHRDLCQQKVNMLTLQRDRLAACLDTFIQEIQSGSKTFCVYYQFKMYNDKTLNPELY